MVEISVYKASSKEQGKQEMSKLSEVLEINLGLIETMRRYHVSDGIYFQFRTASGMFHITDQDGHDTIVSGG